MSRAPAQVAARLVLFAAAGIAAVEARAQSNEGLRMPAPEPSPPPGAELDAGKLSKLPRQKKFVQADYPKEALAKDLEAEVVLLIDINDKGLVDSVAVQVPAEPGGLGFDEAAMVAAQQFEFEPAELSGKPVAVQISYRYKFTLAPKPTPPPAPPPEAPPPPGAREPLPAGPAPPTAKAREPVANFAGILRERGTRLPLAGVLVTVFRDDGDKPVGFEATSDAGGVFRFFDLPPGPWKVLAEPPGYFPFRTTEEIRAGEGVLATYFVEKGSYNPYDVTVTATRPRKEVSRTVLSAQEIEKVPGAAGDPLAVIQNFAGVARAQAFSGQIIVRGSAPQDTRVFVDGAEVPIIYHFFGLRSVLPAGVLDSIEFYPGNFSPFYGRANGGIIDVQVKKLQPKKVGGYADVSLLDTGVFLEAPLGDKGGFALAGRRSYIDQIIKAAVPSDAPVHFLTAPRYYDYQILGNYRPTAAHDVRAMLFGSDDRFKILFTNPADLDTQVTGNTFSTSTTFYRSLLTHRYVPSDRIENTARVAQGRNWLHADIGQLVFDLDLYLAQLRDTLRHKMSDRFTMTYGLDAQFGRVSGLVRLPRPPKEGDPPGGFDVGGVITSRIARRDYWWPAGFVEGEWKPVDGLTLLPGLRLDHFAQTGENVAQPRLTARWQPGGTGPWTAKGGVGLFAQEPQFEEMDRNFGNPALGVERSLHVSAGVEIKPRPWITVDVTGFYKNLWDMVSHTAALTSRDGQIVPLVYDNGARGSVVGAEVVARHEFNHNFSGWLAYTLSHSVRRDSGATAERLFDYDQPHILTVIGSYLLPRNWQVGGRFRLVSGNPRTPVVGSVFNASADRYDPVYGPVNSARNPLFNQLDLRVDKRWVYQRWMLNVYLDVQNVYNRANSEGLTYNFDYRRSGVQQGLPLLTILGIRAEF